MLVVLFHSKSPERTKSTYAMFTFILCFYLISLSLVLFLFLFNCFFPFSSFLAHNAVCVSARTGPMTDYSWQVMYISYRRENYRLISIVLHITFTFSPLTPSSCAADCTVNSQVLRGHKSTTSAWRLWHSAARAHLLHTTRLDGAGMLITETFSVMCMQREATSQCTFIMSCE